jgi:CRISPR-associated protein Csc3
MRRDIIMKQHENEIDSLMFKFGIDTGADDQLFRSYVKEIVNGKLRAYQEIIQTGAKAGESLYLHILNGIFVLERLRPILDLDDVEVQILFAAYSVHDINKLPRFQSAKLSFNELATPESISQALAELEMERFFPEYQDYPDEIRVLVRGHSGHYHTYGETLDKNYNPYRLPKNRVETYLVPIIRAIDVIDLSKTLEERAKKADFLKHINSILDKVQYEFVYHKICEQRGILTNVIQNQIVKYLEGEKSLLPLLFYPDGVAYLVPRHLEIPLTDDDIAAIGGRVVESTESKTKGEFSKFINSRPAGIKIDQKCLALSVPFSEIWHEVRNIISERKYGSRLDNMNAKCQERLINFREKLASAKPSKKNPNPAAQAERIDGILTEGYQVLPPDDDVLRCGELIRTYYIFLSDHFSKTLDDGWQHIYDVLNIPQGEQRDRYDVFDARYDRGYIIGRDLAEAGQSFDDIYQVILDDGRALLDASDVSSEFGVLSDYVYKYVDFSFVPNRSNNFAPNLQRYVAENHQQCSHCGTEFETDLWMTDDVPSNVKVQYFSNRLEGGSTRDPKRRICPICRTQFMLDKLCYRAVRDTKRLFIYLYPISFFTDKLIHAFRDAQQRFRDPDYASVLLKNDEVLRNYREMATLELTFVKTKANGNPLPQFSDAIGNILTIPVNAPGDNDTEKMLFAIENALLYQRFLGCRAVLTDSSIPLFSGTEFDHLFIDHIPPAFRGWLPDNNLTSDETQFAFNQLLTLHQLRAEIGSIETADLVRLIRSLNADVLEPYYVSHKLIKRVKAGQEAAQFATVRKTAPLVAKAVEQKGGTLIMAYIKELARIGWEGRLRGRNLTDNSLAKPLDVAFDSLERWNPSRETEEEARAIMTKEIARAVERLTPSQYLTLKRKFEITERSQAFVDILFDQIYHDNYENQLFDLLENRRRVRAAYLYFITEIIPQREKQEEVLVS